MVSVNTVKRRGLDFLSASISKVLNCVSCDPAIVQANGEGQDNQAYFLDKLILPPGFSYPRLVHASLPNAFEKEPFCSTCGSKNGEVRLVYKHFSGWRYCVDSYAGEGITHDLLVVENGYMQAWEGPHFAIRLHQDGDLLRVVMRHEVIRFMLKTNPEGEKYFECLNADTWSIQRDGQYVVVEGPVRQKLYRTFYFDTPDLGQTWQLVRTYPTLRPDLEVSLTYNEEGFVEHLRYPDGALADFEYSGWGGGEDQATESV